MKHLTKVLFMFAIILPTMALASYWQLYSQTTTYVSNVVYCGDSVLFGPTWIEYTTAVYYPDHIVYASSAYPKHLVQIDEDIKHVTDRSCVNNPLRVKKIDSYYVLMP